MKKKYTRKQIMESIKYWQKQLNESSDYEDDFEMGDRSSTYNCDEQIKEFTKAFNNTTLGEKYNFIRALSDLIDEKQLKNIVRKLRQDIPISTHELKLFNSFMYLIMNAKDFAKEETIDRYDSQFITKSGDKIRHDQKVYESIPLDDVYDYESHALYKLKTPKNIKYYDSPSGNPIEATMYGVVINRLNDEECDSIIISRDVINASQRIRGHQVVDYYRPDIRNLLKVS